MDNSTSFIIASRLKSERTRAQLSHAKLSEAIQKKYDISISVDSLKGYEVDTDYKTKTGSNKGMRIEYLYCLADFYGVSTDYLLGISNSRSRNTEIRTIHNSTGLSESAVKHLVKIKEKENTVMGSAKVMLLNAILEDDSFLEDAANILYALRIIPENATIKISFCGQDKEHELSSLMSDNSDDLRQLYKAELQNIIFSFIRRQLQK